jgi:hypothetical protein
MKQKLETESKSREAVKDFVYLGSNQRTIYMRMRFKEALLKRM